MKGLEQKCSRELGQRWREPKSGVTEVRRFSIITLSSIRWRDSKVYYYVDPWRKPEGCFLTALLFDGLFSVPAFLCSFQI